MEIINVFVGIDPGLSGGIGVLVPDRNIAVAKIMPTTSAGTNAKGKVREEVDAMEAMLVMKSAYTAAALEQLVYHVVIERVSAMPHQGVTSMFNFGVSYGKLLGVLEIWAKAEKQATVHTQRVTPQAWKKVILAGTNKEKEDAIAYVQRKYAKVSLLPTPRCTKPHDGMAEAVCLAEYAAVNRIQ